jgi:YidC/Oxa1 family membrane protein insertase
MLSTIWNTILVTPILNLLVFLYTITGQNMALAIIFLTLLIRGALIPVVIPSLKNMKKQRDLQPELDKLKKKFKYDKQKMAEAQMKLFKKHGLNPASGCLNQILMIIVLIALYNVIRMFTVGVDVGALNDLLYFAKLRFTEGVGIDTSFWYMDLGQKDPYFVLPVIGGLFQLLTSKMMQPYVEAGEKAAKKTPDKSDDLAYNMQEQMLYLMPLMTVVIGASLPSGAALYILVTTIFSMVQQYFVSGWGGLKPWFVKLNLSAPTKS